MHKVGHNRVSCSDNLGDTAGSVVDQLLRVAEPYVGAVRQARDLQKVGKGLGLCFKQHSPYKARSAFRDTKGSGLAVYVLGLDLESLC